MQLTLTLPDAVHSLLAAHPKGAEAAALIAIKRYLKASASEGRDQAIADEAVRGVTHAELANKYALSIPRIQQLVALGRDAALLRNPPAPKPAHTTTTSADKARTAELLKEWAYEPEPTRTTTIHSATPTQPTRTTTTPTQPTRTTTTTPDLDAEFDIDF